MGLEVAIVGKSGRALDVDDNGGIAVTVGRHPLLNEGSTIRFFGQKFMNGSGSSDMRVNGSTMNVDFYIRASTDYDILITGISIQISDAGANLNEFGALTALTNGVDMYEYSAEMGREVIFSEIKTNLDFIRYCPQTPAIGSGAGAFLADLNGGGADTYLPSLNFVDVFGSPAHLEKGTLHEIGFTIKDNLSAGLDAFNVVATGVKIWQ